MAEDDSWDESSDGAAAPAVKEPQQPPKFDDSESDEEPPPQQQTQQQSTQQTTQQQQTTDDSKNQTETSQTQNQSQKPQNNQNNQKNNQKNKTNKPKPARQVSQPKSSKSKNNKNKNTNNNEDDSSTTSDSSDEDTGQQPNTKKMQSYDERNTEDNAILFGSKYRGGGRGGRGGRGRGRGGGGRGAVQEDNRVMLSGDVRLQSFPLGSQQDCIKLAKEVSALMNGKRYDGDINSMDIIKFVSYVIDGLVSKNMNHMDIVDINELKVQIDKIYNRKQKDMRSHKKKKKPIHRFGKKYSAGPVGNTSTNAANQGGKHIDGQYNENDFDFLN